MHGPKPRREPASAAGRDRAQAHDFSALGEFDPSTAATESTVSIQGFDKFRCDEPVGAHPVWSPHPLRGLAVVVVVTAATKWPRPRESATGPTSSIFDNSTERRP